ncbi:MAG: hypothetical protein NC038_06145 [Paludibacter sp.]|nr:hypothetical protein [Bacteroidales bacterium]MCM1069472.1 hypothetical protein [Prevotella sp.]MCM1354128.1 hypothetical protein [Bacteroides sp.]MCM1443015.1 hypothetical protein [Muribaculum sp.]MCM1482203.1 hypothetical protein [Paludibacter sp.]
MEDKKINERESLEIITSMIARTKERYNLGEGNIMLMWGYLTLGISVLVWLLLALTHHPAVQWLWFLIWIIGGIVTPVMAKKKNIKKGVKNYTDKIISQLWAIVGWSAIVCSFVCLGLLVTCGVDAWSAMFVFALIIVPFAEIANGIVLNESSYMWGGAIGFLVGIILTCCIAGGVALTAAWVMPLFIGAYICMMIIPGHVINYKAKNNL